MPACSKKMLPLIALLMTAALLLYLAIRLVATADEPQTIRAEGKQIGEGVRVSGSQVPRSITARQARVVRSFHGPYITSLSRPLEIGPSGPLVSPLTIVIRLDNRPAPHSVLLVAHNATHTAEGWHLVPAELLPDRQHARLTVTHLSWIQVLQLDAQEAARIVHDDFLDGLTNGLTRSAQPPQCSYDSDFERLDVAVRGAGSVYHCLSHENGEVYLKVTNRMSYPVELKLSGLTLATPYSATGLSLSELAHQHGHAVLDAGSQVSLRIAPIKAGQKATLDLELSKFSLGLHTIDVMGDALFTLLAEFNMGAAQKKVDLLSKALEAKNCLATLGDLNLGHILANCLTDDVLKEFFDWQYLAVGPVVAFLGLVEMSHSLAAAYGDSQVNRTRLHLEISPKPAGPPAWLERYVGTWKSIRFFATVNGDGTGFFTWLGTHGESWAAHFSVTQSEGRAVAAVTSSDIITPNGSSAYAFAAGSQFSMDLQPNGILAFNAINGDGELLLCGKSADPTLCGGVLRDGITYWDGRS